MDNLCWFDVFGGLYYDALAIGLLHLEELNVGELSLGVAIFGGFGGVLFGLCIGGFGGDSWRMMMPCYLDVLETYLEDTFWP